MNLTKVYTVIGKNNFMKKYDLFILGYKANRILEEYFDPNDFPNTNIRIIDNGNQTFSERLKSYVFYQSSKNLGCSGGWNLICQIAFDKLGLEKIVISNEDNLYSEEYIEALYNQCTPTNIAGTYDRAFEFSLFCMHRDTYKKVGMFDENVIFVYSEDADYKYRCKLHGVTVSSLGISANYNASASSKESEVVAQHPDNKIYVYNKWQGNTSIELWYQDVAKYPFNNPELRDHPEKYLTEKLKNVYGDINEFPSITEFKNYEKTLSNI